MSGFLAGAGLSAGGSVADSDFWWSNVPYGAPVAVRMVLDYYRYVARVVDRGNLEKGKKVKR